jgi:hypothetical protein
MKENHMSIQPMHTATDDLLDLDLPVDDLAVSAQPPTATGPKRRAARAPDGVPKAVVDTARRAERERKREKARWAKREKHGEAQAARLLKALETCARAAVGIERLLKRSVPVTLPRRRSR